jgi:two-component system OmpR family response regulator/two-component system copper resistance phosphate regulon response regulator CusR
MSGAVENHPESASPASLRILLVEDDLVIGKAVARGLEDAGHACTWTKNGKAGLDEGLSQRHDAIVLDLMLPEIAGLDVLRQLRARGVRTPVVVLTALGSVDDRVAGLREGADDYLVKPFAFPELLARLEAVRRRSADRPAPTLAVGVVSLDLNHVELTPTEFSLLEILMRNAGQVVTRKMLCEHLWEGEWEGVTNVIEVHVNRLRNKLSQAGAEAIIQTIRGRGYALKAA